MVGQWVLEGQVEAKNQIGGCEPGKKVDLVFIINRTMDQLTWDPLTKKASLILHLRWRKDLHPVNSRLAGLIECIWYTL